MYELHQRLTWDTLIFILTSRGRGVSQHIFFSASFILIPSQCQCNTFEEQHSNETNWLQFDHLRVFILHSFDYISLHTSFNLRINSTEASFQLLVFFSFLLSYYHRLLTSVVAAATVAGLTFSSLRTRVWFARVSETLHGIFTFLWMTA